MPQIVYYEDIRRKHNRAVGLITRECALCGKHFDTGPGYVYKIGKKNHPFLFYCSYSCFQKAKSSKTK